VVANQLSQPVGRAEAKVADKGEGEGEKEELVLQETFAQETAVTVEDPNMWVHHFLLDTVTYPTLIQSAKFFF
jgi:hypothetical protein